MEALILDEAARDSGVASRSRARRRESCAWPMLRARSFLPDSRASAAHAVCSDHARVRCELWGRDAMTVATECEVTAVPAARVRTPAAARRCACRGETPRLSLIHISE